MFDHIGVAVSDLGESERFYGMVLSAMGVAPGDAHGTIIEWDDWAIGAADSGHQLARNLSVCFRAPDREAVDAFWRAGIDAGYTDTGEPDLRTSYGRGRYSRFLIDPDGNSVEAAHDDRRPTTPYGHVDHLSLRVRDPLASRRFYLTIAPHAGLQLGHDHPDHLQFAGADYSFSFVRDVRAPSENIHFAFKASTDDAVRAFHAAALAAGYADNGGPGERPGYAPGYYAAFVIDPSGFNVEMVHHNTSGLPNA